MTIKSIAPIVIAIGAFFSCQSNELEQVLAFENFDKPPIRSTEGVLYTFTDSGHVKNILEAGRVDRFETSDSTYSLISGGFALTFFNDYAEFDGKLTALNGWISGNNSKMIARDSVVFENREGETLRTEELTWLQDSAQVFTDKFVTIEQGDGVIYGKGLKSNQNFTDYEIMEVTGEIYLKDERR